MDAATRSRLGASILALGALVACNRTTTPSDATAPPDPGAVADNPAPDDTAAAQLDWMVGTWMSLDDAGRETTERWWAGEDGTLLGENVTREGGRETHSETLRVETRDGHLVYIASPSTQATTEFTGDAQCGSDTMGNCSRSCEAVFRNPEHDFPTEITYGRCVQSDALVAKISGGDRSVTWTFHQGD